MAPLDGIKWAAAGRSEKKVAAVLEKTLKQSSSIDIIEADVEDYESLLEMCRSTRVLVNCVGPFRFYGEQVVQACLDSQTDYVDITGEPEFIEEMMYKYHLQAREKNITIVHACGFDSIPTDMGVIKLKKFMESKQIIPCGAEMFFKV